MRYSSVVALFQRVRLIGSKSLTGSRRSKVTAPPVVQRSPPVRSCACRRNPEIGGIEQSGSRRIKHGHEGVVTPPWFVACRGLAVGKSVEEVRPVTHASPTLFTAMPEPT